MSPVWRPGQPPATPPKIVKAGGQMGATNTQSGHKKAGD